MRNAFIKKYPFALHQVYVNERFFNENQ